MSEKIFVIGHKSPDLDSVASAIAFAYFKNETEGVDMYVPAMAGNVNKETDYLLKKLNFDKPQILENIKNEKLYLVDHNEFSQMATGGEQADIVGILDHHKLDFKYSEPIRVEIQPWGACCSIIADKFFRRDMEPSKDLAMLMLGAILIDTVITKSPTCTEVDKIIIEKLADIAEVEDWRELGMNLFKIRSSVKELGDLEIIKSDYKDFEMKAGRFGIGQVETADLGEFKEREEGLLKALEKLKQDENYHSVILFLTDIIKGGSQFLVVTDDEKGFNQAMGAELENGKVYIKGIMSRKKQVAPELSKVFDK